MKRIKELDGLRAIAILLVISCHYEGFVQLSHGISEFGWVGVDIFFVLSGYLITSILLGLRGSERPYTTFYSRRIIRIFPAYFCITFLMFVTAFVLHDRDFISVKNVVKQLFFLQAFSKLNAVFVLSWLLHPMQQLAALPGLFFHAGHLSLGGPGQPGTIEAQVGTYWSLSIEEFFYLFWAPIVLHFRRKTVARIGIAICVAELLLRWSFGSREAYFGICFRFDALIYGAFLAMLIESWKIGGIPAWATRSFRVLFAFAVVGLTVMLVLVGPVVGREIRESPLFLAFGLPMISLACVGIIGMLLLRAGSGWWFARALRIRPMQVVGRVSYAMYLVELVAMGIVTRVLWGDHPGLALWRLLIQGLLATALTIGIALVSWHFLEGPLLRWREIRLQSPNPAKAKAAALDAV